MAVIRELEIIGEAAYKLPDELKNQYPSVPWRDITDFRNIQNYPQSVKPGFSLRLIVFHQYLFRNPVSTGDRTSPIPQLQSLIANFSIDTLS